MHPCHPIRTVVAFALAAVAFNAGVRVSAEESDPVVPAPAPLELKKPVITSDLGGRELAFLTKANENGVIMHYVSELAKTKAESESVRELGERFAATQEEETNRLIELSAGKGLNFKAQTPPALKKIHARLMPLTGTAFDKACAAELAALAKLILSNYASGCECKDPEIKSFADEGRQRAQEQFDAAGKLDESLRATP